MSNKSEVEELFFMKYPTISKKITEGNTSLNRSEYGNYLKEMENFKAALDKQIGWGAT